MKNRAVWLFVWLVVWHAPFHHSTYNFRCVVFCSFVFYYLRLDDKLYTFVCGVCLYSDDNMQMIFVHTGEFIFKEYYK